MWVAAEEGREPEHYKPDLPPLEVGDYLAAFLFEIGPTMSGASGGGALTFSEIDAWCTRTGIDLEPWESRILRRLSRDYLSESGKAEKRDCPAPWRVPGAKPEPTAAQIAIRGIAKQ